MKTIRDVFPKAELAALPKVMFEGRIVCIQTEAEANKAIDYLMTYPRVGVDTETRQSFVTGHVLKDALIKKTTAETCYLFFKIYIDFPE